MNVYLTKINGWSLRDKSHYMQHMVMEIAHQLGCREMGIYRYNAEAESAESRNSRLDGIIAGMKRGDIVICQFPTGNGLKFERALVNRIKVYGGRIAIFVYEMGALADEGKRSALRDIMGLYNQAEVLIVPTYAMVHFLTDNGVRKKMKFVVQEMWDYTADDRFPYAPAFRKEIHATDSIGSVGINSWNYSVPLKLYSGSSNGGQNVHNMGELEADRLFSELSKGGFGLVWYKDEYARRYMEYSASFSLTRYLAAGIPVIIPAGMSSCSIIEENHLGMVVNSLEEASAAVEAMEESEYWEYVQCVEQFAPALRKGYYTKKCLINAMQAFYREDAGKILIPEESYHLGECVFTSTELHESYGGNLALSWNFKGKPDGFLICDISGETVLHDIRDVYQHYFLLKNHGEVKGVIVKAYLDTLRGKLIIAESMPFYIEIKQCERPEVSVIIPAYNAEENIARSIDTALAQAFRNLEIIVVDDGSTDQTPKIIDWYADKYKNVIAIHQKNMGAAAARNTGIKKANGGYIGFLDSDDMFRPNMIGRLHHSAKKNNCDIAITSAYQITDRGYGKLIQYPMEEDVAIPIDEFFLEYYIKECGFGEVLWNKMYRASLVKEHLIPELVAEDAAWTPYILSYVDRVCYLDDCAYEYNRISYNTSLSAKVINKSKEEQVIITKNVVMFYLQNGNVKKMNLLRRLAKKKLDEKAKVFSDVEYKKIWQEIEETFLDNQIS